jgi:molybdate transport repressor ModE-like protein
MKRVSIKPTWVVENESGGRLGPELFAMLNAVHKTGKLTEAAAEVGLSYRHAWDLVGNWGEFFGSPLLRMERGKGAALTALGEKLLWAEQRGAARLGLQLESLASELNLELNRTVASAMRTIRLHASHGFAVARLPDLLKQRDDIQLDLRYLGSVESLASLIRQDCDLAGLHVPEGRLGPLAMRRYVRWLQPARQRLIHLVTRTQGLFVARGNPKNIRELSDLATRDAVFVNRQKGSGTRWLLDQLLESAGTHTHAIRGYQNEEFTHAAVAAYVASGMADVGFGVQPAAVQFRLDFVPIAREHYVLLCNLPSLERPEVAEFLSLLRSETFQTIVGELAGYTAPRAGEIVRLEEEYPELVKADRASSRNQ